MAALTDGFVYFCSQLEELSPGMKLTQYCPFEGVEDMRVGLDRLLTILRNAKDFNEQFYQGLKGLSLDGLGPFYASRYEGFKLVTAKMLLSLDRYLSDDIGEDKKKADSGNGFCYRVNKKNLSGNIADEKLEKGYASVLRYIATFNHRGSFSEYIRIIDEINKYFSIKEDPNYPVIEMALLAFVAISGTGKKGKNFSYQEIEKSFIWVKSYLYDVESNRMKIFVQSINELRRIKVYFDVKLDISEVMQICKGMTELPTGEFQKHISSIRNTASVLSNYSLAQEYIDTWIILLNNKNNIGLDKFLTQLHTFENIESYNRNDPYAHKPIFGDNYSFAWMSEDGEIKENIIYLSKNILDNHHVKYKVLSSTTKEIFEGELDLSIFNNLSSGFELKDLSTIRGPILEELSRRGHAVKKLDVNIRIATARLLAVCSNDGIDGNIEEKVTNLYKAVLAFFQNHGKQTTSEILELLGHIDVTSSTLPSLDAITILINEINKIETLDYQTLEQEVRNRLPEGCSIQMSQVVITSAEPLGNLDMIITKYMGDILDELRSHKSTIDTVFGQGFFASLSTASGSKILLDNLNVVAEKKGFLNDMVQGKIKNVMNTVYDNVIKQGIEHISNKNNTLKIQLERVIKLKFNHSVKLEGDFLKFTKGYASELSHLSDILDNLKRIKKQWPSDLSMVINSLDESPNINEYSLAHINGIISALVKNYSPKNPFPIELLAQFFFFKNPSEKILRDSQDILDVLYDEQENQVNFSDNEKRLLNMLALRCCLTNDISAKKYLEELLEYSGRPLFGEKLELLSCLTNITLEEGLLLMSDMNSLGESTTKSILAYFTGDKTSELPAFLKALNSSKSNIKESLINIVLKAANKKNNDSEPPSIVSVIEHLKKFGEDNINAVAAVFQTPHYPTLSQLLALHNDDQRFKEKILEYNLKPFGERNEEEDFSTKKLIDYLNHLQDMNYDHPLLFSERQTLQKWFLYINAIGKEHPISTVGESSSPKSIKDMTHAEIQALLKDYKERLASDDTNNEEKLKIKLESIALLREAMYRGTGKFPRTTQILYLLTSMLRGDHYVAQIQTGQGKSLTAAMTAAMENLEGKTVDICTSTLFLASEGLEENINFFEYLGIPVKLIHAGSAKDDYQEGAIHYSSMADLALYRSKMQLIGKVFPEKCTLVADEIDFSTLDDNTRYRYATNLDPVIDPYDSPYTWIYESLVGFVDTCKTPQTDVELIKKAEDWITKSAITKAQKQQLKNLQAMPLVFAKRLETWLIAAGKTKALVNEEEVKFRIVTLDHPKFGQVSKACILTGGRPNVQAEFSDAIQQFLHVRLRQKYQIDIETEKKKNFLVEPEKSYITTMNSKILMNTYSKRMGMSGTPGSEKEIKEQYAKYGFRFVAIPPHVDSKRRDLKPRLTNAKYISKPEEEKKNHIALIVKETLRHIERYAKKKKRFLHC